MRRHTTHPRTRGFTLIEAITAVVVLAVAVPGMFWGIRDAQMRRIDPIQASKARWLAAEKLEDIIADRHSATRGYAYVIGGNYGAEASVSGYPGFSRAVAIAESGASLVAGSGTGYKRVTVSVSFRDGRNTLRTLSLATVVTDYAP
jgi:prepilin-type N-terminal cleavage/methylation domain-containing protein